jgi:Transposase IS4
VSTNNGREWYLGVTDVDVNGPVPMRPWKFVSQYTGEVYTPGCDDAAIELTPYDFFMAVFPRKQLKEMVTNTSANLKAHGQQEITTGELLKWFGITILITRYEFGDRASLWATEPPNKYIPAPSIGTRTGMSRNRYDIIIKCLVWSFQPPTRPEGMSSEEHRWMLVTDFVNNLNEHKKNYFIPSTLICVDESMSRWYGLGGHWINIGLPMYVAMDRKPEDGCEIQNSCCGKSGILLQLKLVKSASAEIAATADDGGVVEANGYAIVVAKKPFPISLLFTLLLCLTGFSTAAMSSTIW